MFALNPDSRYLIECHPENSVDRDLIANSHQFYLKGRFYQSLADAFLCLSQQKASGTRESYVFGSDCRLFSREKLLEKTKKFFEKRPLTLLVSIAEEPALLFQDRLAFWMVTIKATE